MASSSRPRVCARDAHARAHRAGGAGAKRRHGRRTPKAGLRPANVPGRAHASQVAGMACSGPRRPRQRGPLPHSAIHRLRRRRRLSECSAHGGALRRRSRRARWRAGSLLSPRRPRQRGPLPHSAIHRLRRRRRLSECSAHGGALRRLSRRARWRAGSLLSPRRPRQRGPLPHSAIHRSRRRRRLSECSAHGGALRRRSRRARYRPPPDRRPRHDHADDLATALQGRLRAQNSTDC